jgi:hypothetical protein
MRCVVYCVLLMCAVLSGTSQAKTITGNQLLEKCTPALRVLDGDNAGAVGGDGDKAWFCLGFVSANLEAFAAGSVWEVGFHSTVRMYPCFPVNENVTLDQGPRIILKYLRVHPERLHESGFLLSLAALNEAFPCKK